MVIHNINYLTKAITHTCRYPVHMSSSSVADVNLDSIILQSGQRLGYASIRLNQLNAIKSFMEGNDIFVILPTGSGKSLCFTVLPFAFDCLYQRDSSIVIVVSPLIALMKDQVRSMFCNERCMHSLVLYCRLLLLTLKGYRRPILAVK